MSEVHFRDQPQPVKKVAKLIKYLASVMQSNRDSFADVAKELGKMDKLEADQWISL